MKKLIVSIAAILLIAYFCMGAGELRTTMGSYRTIQTTVDDATETSPATTDFAIRSSDQTAAFDLMNMGGASGQTSANALVVIVSAEAVENDTCTIEYWGIADGGPLEKICTISYIFGTAVRSTGILWADTATVTDSHTSIIKDGGANDDDVARTQWDMTGFRYIRPYVTAQSGAEDITIEARYF